MCSEVLPYGVVAGASDAKKDQLCRIQRGCIFKQLSRTRGTNYVHRNHLSEAHPLKVRLS